MRIVNLFLTHLYSKYRMKINKVLVESTEFQTIIIESNDDLIDYARVIADNKRYYGISAVDWRHIFRHIVRESTNSVVNNFISHFKSCDQRNKITIKVGAKVAILDLSISLDTSDRAYLYGDINPQTISKVFREPTSEKIIKIEFNNDPEQTYPRKYRAIHQGNEIDHSIFFPSKESAQHAVTMLTLSAPDNMLDTKGVKGM